MRWRVLLGVALLAAGCGVLVDSFVDLACHGAGQGPFAAPPHGRPPRSSADLRAHFEIPGTGHKGAIYLGWMRWALTVAIVLIGLAGTVGVRWRGARWVALGLGVIAARVAYRDERAKQLEDLTGAVADRAECVGTDSGQSRSSPALVGVKPHAW